MQQIYTNFDVDKYPFHVYFSQENSEGGLQIPLSAVTSYFKEQTSGKWELQMPEDITARESYRLPIGFVTTGFVRGR